MIKKILLIITIMFLIGVTSCKKEEVISNDEPKVVQLDTPVISLTDNVVSWNLVENATEYTVYVNDVNVSVQTERTYTIFNQTPGNYIITVMAVGDSVKYLNSNLSNSVTYKVEEKVEELSQTTLFLVGDSTVSMHNDTSYYYPRYGYGTQIGNYLSDKVTVKNYALSGRSSRSYMLDAEYTNFVSEIKAGDYVIIGFGHNDQKSEIDRYANPNLPYTDSNSKFENTKAVQEISFQYVLYNYYIKVAKEAGATPILCTPMVRLNKNNDYLGSSGHVTSTSNSLGVEYIGGDYAKAIKTLGNDTGTTVIDLTELTKDFYSQKGYNDGTKYFAQTKPEAVDTTHTNILGAKQSAYFIANSLLSTNNDLSKYVKEQISAPTVENDLVSNPDYVEKAYESFSLENASAHWILQSENWYGTAFGDTGGSPIGSSNGKPNYIIKEDNVGEFVVGNETGKGKIASGSEGFAMIFKPVDVSKNFKFSATVTIDSYSGNQAGFGISVRDDIYIDTNDNTIKSNSINAGFYSNKTSTFAIYTRENTTLTGVNTTSYGLAKGFTANLSIERVGSSVEVIITTTINDVDYEYNKTYYDFDLIAIDENFMYVGMYATRNTMATFTNVLFEITGDAQEA